MVKRILQKRRIEIIYKNRVTKAMITLKMFLPFGFP